MRIFNISLFVRAWMPIVAITIALSLAPQTVLAWGDNSEDGEGRPSHTIEQIDNGAIGATPQSDGEDYKNSSNYPGQIIFNTISDSTIGNEKNYVGAREVALLEDRRAEDAALDATWHGNDITVADGAYYAIRLYVHNNNPNGYDAVAENTRVSFSIPNDIGNQIKVNGFIKSSNAEPSEYWDYVNFNSDVPFHLEYVYGSALLNNDRTQDEAAAGGYLDNAGWVLNDDIVNAASVDGVLIGSDALDGRVPGGQKYDNYVTIIVRAVFDYEYTVEQKVRLAGSNEDNWEDAVEAKVGDQVEFRILYKNMSGNEQKDIAIKGILPSNLKYIPSSTILKNTTYPNGGYILNDGLVNNGIRIGDYKENGGNALVYFTAEVVDDSLATGANTLTSWSQAGVGLKTIQDHASVIVYKNAAWFLVITTILLILIALCLAITAGLLFCRWQIKRNS